ncbi:MAG TPA: hypothetical protein PKI20_13585 [Verrucomicrobiota bacterium]|nr:hypothetical protein [Verrucomicrobiota bacterium]HQL78695.1 hypothetical protein [Verrucomicrobiota bacterium]
MVSPLTIRAGQKEFSRGVAVHRVAGLLARRQYGKTTIAARVALRKMMKRPGHTVIFGSVKLDLGREIVRKEAAALQAAFQAFSTDALQIVDAQTGKNISPKGPISPISPDDFAELYEATRLEFRLYHSRSIYSRTKVVALNTAAVGETGDLILDEVGRVKNFRDVVEAIMPVIASNPDFRCIYTTTPPPDDTHYSFELLAPPIGADLPVNPAGNWYQSELGVWVLRITAWDAYADAVPLYDDDSGAPLSPEESRARAHDKDAWDRNYACRFVLGGTAACGLLQLDTAQRRGIGQSQLFQVNNDLEFDQSLSYLTNQFRIPQSALRIGLGWDLATTTSETSNPSSLTILQQIGQDLLARAVITWKTADPDVALERVRRVVEATRPRRLCIDATNERYFAQMCRKELGPLVPVELVIGSETIDVPGEPAPITMKQYLGAQLVAELDDNHLTLPPERYLREDWRLVRKEKGQFVCEPDANGRHGDTFDSTKLALRALRSTAGALLTADGISTGNNALRPGSRLR